MEIYMYNYMRFESFNDELVFAEMSLWNPVK